MARLVLFDGVTPERVAVVEAPEVVGAVVRGDAVFTYAVAGLTYPGLPQLPDLEPGESAAYVKVAKSFFAKAA